jgi:hypothetical protein
MLDLFLVSLWDPFMMTWQLVFIFLIKTRERNQAVIFFFLILKTGCHVSIEGPQK